jgi:hypothetical protein
MISSTKLDPLEDIDIIASRYNQVEMHIYESSGNDPSSVWFRVSRQMGEIKTFLGFE